MNKAIEKLKRTEERARVLADQRDANETRWIKQYEAAKKTPEWKAYCTATGTSETYNYGDMIC